MVFNATFNNISVLLVEETRENNPPVVSHWQTLSHNVVPSTPRLSGIQTHNVSDDRSKNVHVYMIQDVVTQLVSGSLDKQKIKTIYSYTHLNLIGLYHKPIMYV